MELLIGGIILGFVLSCVCFMQKIWRLEDRAREYKSRARFYKAELDRELRNRAEWESVCGKELDFSKKW